MSLALTLPGLPVPAPRPELVLRPYQERALEQVRALIRRGKKRILVVAPTGCHRAGQGILMHDGSVRCVETIEPGDALMGPDGAPRVVLELRQGRQQMARVAPTKGEAFVVNLDHVLTLVRTNDGWHKSGNVVDVTVRTWLGWSRTHRHIHKLFRVGVEFPAGPALPIEPYFLGVLLGDGTIRHSIGVSTMDAEIEAECQRQAARFGLRLRAEHGPTVNTFFLSGHKNHPNPITLALRELGLHGHRGDRKFVPAIYKTASRADRLEVLAGLIDSDGARSRGGFDFISQSETLARDVAFLARSLALAAYVTPCEKRDQHGHGGTYFRVSISGDCACVPTRLARKRAPARAQKKDVLRTGFDVELLDVEDYFGFTLDGDGRYLLDDFTVTHNSGKTILFSRIARGAADKGSGVVVLAHRRELIDQTFDKLRWCGVESLGVIQGKDRRRDGRALVQVASVQTLVNRRPPPAKLLVIDEAHRALAASYERITALYPDAVQLGFTATPWRLDGRGLGRVYEDLVVVATVRELVDEGFLVRPRVFTHPTRPDLSKVKTRGGDYDEQALAKAVDTKPLIGNIVEHWQRLAGGVRTLAFAASVEHSKHIVAAFVAAGVPAEHVDGTTDEDTRAAILRRLKSGETLVVGNCDVLTEGFDEPLVKCAILARPTKSRAGYFQRLGRALRTIPGEPEVTTALILDHAGCAHEHGLPEEPQTYDLSDAPKRRAASESEAPVRICERCYLALPGGTAVCPECGFVFPIRERKVIEEAEGQLAELKATQEREVSRLRAQIQGHAHRADEARRWHPGETNRRLYERFRKSRTLMSVRELEAVLAHFASGDFDACHPVVAPAIARPVLVPPPPPPVDDEVAEWVL